MPQTFALVAGEASGDQLGAALIRELGKLYPESRFVGIGGAAMRAAGMDTWWDSEELAVFGLFEVLSHFRRLYRIRSSLKQRLLDSRPDAFIGIDAPDFNLGLETRLKSAGIPTVHYVSPTVWAWREKRVKKIARAADLVLCLFPFEPAWYSGHDVSAAYVGHPMADQIAPGTGHSSARSRLGLDSGDRVVALLPGSRRGEVSRLAGPMIEAAGLLSREHPGIRLVVALANEAVRELFEETLQASGDEDLIRDMQRVDGHPRTVIAASDVVMCASGTATLETMLINRPMAVCYRVAPSTYQLARLLKLVKIRYVSLPNILAGEALVPELLQNDATGPHIARSVSRWLNDPGACKGLQNRFATMHHELRCNASQQAAAAVRALLAEA
jgi:lipid-A-disaccharide synthase